jgi:hypothetical protein
MTEITCGEHPHLTWPIAMDCLRRRKDAKIARLRAALQSLTTDPPATLDEPDTDAEVVIKMREIVRAALASA